MYLIVVIRSSSSSSMEPVTGSYHCFTKLDGGGVCFAFVQLHFESIKTLKMKFCFPDFRPQVSRDRCSNAPLLLQLSNRSDEIPKNAKSTCSSCKIEPKYVCL